MRIRTEQENDVGAVREINLSAFATPSEADLVDALRDQTEPIVSLVAEQEEMVIGHIMFSPASLAGHPDLKIMGLAPMAVAPEYQQKGFGSALVRAGIECCKQLGFVAVVVLGHTKYYPRFGFSSASRFGIESEYDVPEDLFMVLELQADALNGKTGTVTYHPAFRSL